MRPYLLAFAFLSSVFPLSAEVREWKNADGSQSFKGDYVSQDQKNVTIRRADGKVFTIEILRLSDIDRQFVAKQPGGQNEEAAQPDPNAVFDNLCFGDSRAEVTAKLKSSKMLEQGVGEAFMGRTGLNGVYRTRKKIGGLQCELYFDWTGGDTLKEISIQTQAVPTDVYVNRLKGTWEELAEILTTLHGKPVQAGEFPKLADLNSDTFMPSHLWKVKGGTALLGATKQGATCMVIVRFTTKKIEPVELGP